MKKISLVLVLFMLVSFTLAACDVDTSSVTMPTPEPTPTATAPPAEDDLSEDSNEPEENTEAQTETAPGDVKAQMAGNWRWYEFSPYNATLMHLFADGRWESPGPLPTDMSIGGSFVIASEESGIYQLKLIIAHTSDHPASSHIEIGSAFPEFGGFKYDAQNDRLGMEIPAEGNVFQTVWFTRE